MKCKPIIAGVLLAGLAAAGCSSSSSSSGATSTSPKQAACAAKTRLVASVKALANPSLLTGGTAGITTAVDAVQQDLDALGTAATKSLKPEVDALGSSLEDLNSAVEGLSASNISGSLQKIGTAVSDVGTSADALFTELQELCPSGSSTTGGNSV